MHLRILNILDKIVTKLMYLCYFFYKGPYALLYSNVIFCSLYNHNNYTKTVLKIYLPYVIFKKRLISTGNYYIYALIADFLLLL